MVKCSGKPCTAYTSPPKNKAGVGGVGFFATPSIRKRARVWRSFGNAYTAYTSPQGVMFA